MNGVFNLGVIAAAVRRSSAPAVPDTYFGNVVLLLHGDGVDGSTAFVDSSGYARTATSSGTINIDTAVSVFGGASIDCGLGAGHLEYGSSVDFDLSTGDYTIEAQIVPDGISGFFYVWANDGGAGAMLLALDGLTTIYHGIYGGSNITAACSLTAGTPYHLAVARQGSVTRIFIDGALLTTGGTLGSSVGTRGIRIGADPIGGTRWHGHIDELRITKGVARYTAAFTPPTAAFPNTGALLFTPGTNIVLTDDGRTVGSSASWVTSPLNRVIPATGKTFVEFTIGSGHQMLGAMLGNTPQALFLGQFSNSVSNGDDIRNGGGIFSTTTSGNLSSSGTDFGVAVDQDAGTLRWYINGVLQTPVIAFTPGTSGMYFAAGVFNGREPVTVKQSSANTPVGYAYLGALPATVLKLSFDSGFSDSSQYGHAHSVVSPDALVSPLIDLAVAKYGSGSAKFITTLTPGPDVSGEINYTPSGNEFDLAGDFTIECWLMYTSVGAGTCPIIGRWGASGGWALFADQSANISFGGSVGGVLNTFLSVASPSVLDTFFHVAVTRQGNTFKMFIDGVASTPSVNSSTIDATSGQPLRVGGSSVPAAISTTYHRGRIDDVRILRGVAAYTSTFTPPTAALPSS